MRDPDKQHPSGSIRLWRITPPDPPVRPDHAAGLVTWIINGPFHMAWQWWMLGLVHLRPIPDVPKADKQYPEAEYELMIVSLNPERGEPDIEAIERGEDWGDPDVPKHLTPFDLVYQFHGVTDEQAVEIADHMASLIAEGRMSPDQDYRSVWEKVIGGLVIEKRVSDE